MRAAVVHSFDRPLRSRTCPSRARARSRCSSASRRPGSATPTSTPRAASGRSSRRRRSSPATRASGSSSASAPATRTGSRSACASRCPGSATPAATAATATAAARRCARAAVNTGYAINGGFAEYAVGYARHVVRVPDGIDPADAAPLTCAGVTTYKAVKVSGADSSSLVAVFGAGGLGHLAVQYARITGASVVAVDVNAGAARDGARARRRAPRPRRARRTRSPRSSGSAAPTPRSRPPSTPKRVRAGVRLAGARRHARLRRPAGRERHARSRSSRPCSAASIRGLDRRHAPRPRGGLRAAPPRPDPGRATPSAASTTSTRRSSRSSTAAPRRRGSCSGSRTPWRSADGRYPGRRVDLTGTLAARGKPPARLRLPPDARVSRRA